jgi:hypothetical protein
MHSLSYYLLGVGVFSAALLLLTAATAARDSSPEPSHWKQIEPGLELGEFPASKTSSVGDSTIRILRIDPAHFEFKLLNAAAFDPPGWNTVRGWVETHGLVAAINGSMFQPGGKSTSLMKTSSHTNNGHVTKDNVVLAFEASGEGDPSVQLIDRTCQDFPALRQRYGTLVQSIRMVSCKGNNVWTQQPRKWGTAAIGSDRQGRILFIHCRSPYSVHDLIDMLLELPIDLKRAMYVEGGPESGFYAKSGEFELETYGCYETGFWEKDDCEDFWLIPNVVGISRRL